MDQNLHLLDQLTPRIAALLRDGDLDGRYENPRNVIAAVVAGTAAAGLNFHDTMRLLRNPEYGGGRWLHDHPDPEQAQAWLQWCFGGSRAAYHDPKLGYREKTPIFLWLATHACWTGRSADSQYRTLVALITAAHDRGEPTFTASERVLATYALVSRTTLSDALDMLVADGIVRRTHLPGGSCRYELHREGWRLLLARTPEGVERHPDERRIVQQRAPVPSVTRFPVPAAAPPAEPGPLEHLLPYPPSQEKKEECSNGAGSTWILDAMSVARGWVPCHPAFGYGTLDQRLFLLVPDIGGASEAWLAAVSGMTRRVLKGKLAALVKARLIVEAPAGYRRVGNVSVLAAIASANGGFESMRKQAELVERDRRKYLDHLDPAGAIQRIAADNYARWMEDLL